MSESTRIPWRRITAEAVAIVASILLAFGIQAWWDDRADQQLRVTAVSDLLSDFEANQLQLSVWLEGTERIVAAHEHLLDALSQAGESGSVELPDSLLVAAVGVPTYQPIRATVDALFATGRLSLIRDPELQRLIALWLQALEDTAEDELFAAAIVTEGVSPLLARQTPLRSVYAAVATWFFDGASPELAAAQRTMRSTTELVGLLSQRLFHTQLALDGLRGLSDSQTGIITRLRAELEAP